MAAAPDLGSGGVIRVSSNLTERTTQTKMTEETPQYIKQEIDLNGGLADYIKMDNCVKGHLYRIDSRNLSLGVYDGKEGFIGIRTKFRDRYLFTEYHHDQGAPHGTVFPLEDLGPIPEEIPINESILHEHSSVRKNLMNGEDYTERGWAWHRRGPDSEEEPVVRRDQRPDEDRHGNRHGFVDLWASDNTRLLDNEYPYSKGNRALFDYLDGHLKNN